MSNLTQVEKQLCKCNPCADAYVLTWQRCHVETGEVLPGVHSRVYAGCYDEWVRAYNEGSRMICDSYTNGVSPFANVQLLDATTADHTHVNYV